MASKRNKAVSIGEEMPIQVIIKGMAMGTVMYKVKSADKWYRRKYKIDIQSLRLSYSPSSKPFWKGKVTSVCKCGAGVGSNVVDLFDLEEVRKGWNSDVFNCLEAKFRRKIQARLHPQLLSKLREENCFSLVLGPGHAVVDLIAPNVHARDAWVRGLRQLIACCKYMQTQHDEERWLKEQVRKADVNGNGSLNFEECMGLLNLLNIGMRRREAKKLFDAANFRKVKIDGEDALEPEEFVQFYRSLTHRPELEELMKKYSVSKSAIWGCEELRNFLNTEQHMSVTMDECAGLIEEHEPDENKIEGYLSLEGFQQLMLSPDFDIFNKKHRIIYQDMTLPLSHYFIASSHNTYLTSGQLIGDSSIEGYIAALMRGCRCLELDTWDGPDDEPIIFHGYTLTSRIFLRDVLEAIKKYAFRASQYPVILSIENHCSLPYQVKMAQHFVNILGDYLYKETVGEEEKAFPSPEALARKIFIKSKKLKERPNCDGVMMSPEPFLLEDEEEREEAVASALAAAQAAPMAAPSKKLKERPNCDGVMMSPEPFLLEDQEEREEAVASALAAGHAAPEGIQDLPFELMALAAPMAAPSRKTIAPDLSDLVNYFCAQRFTSFNECKVCWQFTDMSSFSESVALALAAEDGGSDFVTHNRKHVSRIYPKGTRTDSTNYEPWHYWSLGCQMVALNYQTWDEPMYMNEAKFSQNGKCGYVLKPKYLTDDVPYDPRRQPNPDKQLRVSFKIISAQFLPKPNRASEGEVVDPYVSIKVVGHARDCRKKKTKFISNNGFNPIWNETIEFFIDVPEEAIFNFRVKDQNVSSNELIGHFALPCTSITQGYRHVHLEDPRGQKLDRASLFVHVKFTEKVTYRKSISS